MTTKHSIEILSAIFELTFKVKPESCEPLPRSGSDRIYYRLKAGNQSAIGAYNPDVKENEAFFSFTQTFLDLGINVPTLFAVTPDRLHYLISDLGSETFYDHIINIHNTGKCSGGICLLKGILAGLLKIQFEGAKAVNFSKCYPRATFDRQSILWDLNYFKYEFLKLTGTSFDEQLLEDDFNRLADFLMRAPSYYFMYRDFQSRNIMMIGKTPWFIDYQGGRRGPLQYDLASILFSPKTGLNEIQREVMLGYYMKLLESYTKVNYNEFIDFYYAFALIRILQAMGAYGFRGIFEQKPNFRNSIPVAIQNLKSLLDKGLFKIELPEIFRIINQLSTSEFAKQYELPKDTLTVRVTSFSYKKGIPADPSENGGGFVFDCRGLPNPGRLKEFKQLNGLDQPVIDYLEQYKEVNEFQQKAREIVKLSIDDYLDRGFNHLMVSFGCTGGQHRSVYHAKNFAQWVENNFPVSVVLIHTEQKNKIKDE
jgi:aminoglycoside/choline kinase family phosphotransferase